VKLPVFDSSGEPLQQRGVSPCPGFYFLGLRRMYTMKSNIFEGVGDDAAYLAEYINSPTSAGRQLDRDAGLGRTHSDTKTRMGLLLSCGF
jgi:hypothetical protein